MVVITIDREFVRKYEGIDKTNPGYYVFSTLNFLKKMKEDDFFKEFIILENLNGELKDENEEDSDEKFFKEGIEFHIAEDAFHDLDRGYNSIMLRDIPITKIHPKAFNLDKKCDLTIRNCDLKEFSFENSRIINLIIDGKYLLNQREDILKGMEYLTDLEIDNFSDEYKNTRLNLENYIKNEYFPNLNGLQFDGDFKILDKNIIKSLKNIEFLSYYNFKTEEIYEGIFEDLDNIEELTLMTDNADELSNDIFGKENLIPISIKTITFRHCDFTSINFISKYKPSLGYEVDIHLDSETYIKFTKQINILNERNIGIRIL